MKTTSSTAGRIGARQQNGWGYLFLAPLLVLFSLFMGSSAVFLLVTSFQSVDMSFVDTTWVGWRNYGILFEDQDFLRALLNNVVLSSFSIFCGLTLGFAVALFLSFVFRGRRALTVVFFVPTMLPMALMAVVFAQMLGYHGGLLNEAARWLGLSWLDQRWLSDPNWAMASVSSMSIYLIGLPIMYYMADLSAVNTSVFEAAVMDGARLRQIMLGVIYPLLKNTHKTIALAALLGGFREMERVYLMTDGGPGGATEILGTYVFRNARLVGSDLGVVAAASVVILLLAFALGALYLALDRQRGQR